VGAVFVLIAFGDARRPWTSLFVVGLAIALYEAGATRAFGGTVGKRAVRLRVVRLDRPGRADLPAALRRGAVHAAMTIAVPLLVVLGLGLVAEDEVRGGLAVLLGVTALATWWVSTVVGDPVGRGFADRVADTMVIPDRYPAAISVRDLPGFADGARPPRLSRWGRVADADVRVRARLRRLDDAPVLAAAVGLLVLAVPLLLPDEGEPVADDVATRLLIGATALWIALFVAHETRLVRRRGATPGHELAGLTIVSRSTGQRPTGGRGFLRALVLGLMLYVPLLWPLLGISLLLMRSRPEGRGLHDLVGGTVVVSDPALAPEEQRQRAMRLRLGRAG
jgi:uncharacterized RDD family membrane protein YckC